MMFSKISSRLDCIADLLEKKGLVKEALELDILANTLENSKGDGFPIKDKWKPGVFGDWDGFTIKEAAAGILSKHSSDLEDMTFSGSGIKRDGSKRTWDNVKATGEYFVGRDRAVMVEVLEGAEKRHLNLGTFTGTGVSKKAKYKFLNGVKSLDNSSNKEPLESANPLEDKQPEDILKDFGPPKLISDSKLSYACYDLVKKGGFFGSPEQSEKFFSSLKKGSTVNESRLESTDLGVIQSPKVFKDDVCFISWYIIDKDGVRASLLDWYKLIKPEKPKEWEPREKDDPRYEKEYDEGTTDPYLDIGGTKLKWRRKT